VYIVLRNLAPDRGVTNGTRLKVTESRPHYIVGRILEGVHAGREELIPRFDLIIPEGDNAPSSFKRRQIPEIPAFVMTINKAQGQTLDRVVICLPRPLFSHGKLYVALSQCGDPAQVRVLSGEREASQVENVGYRDVL
jgi:ATP-dependent DNA helicase PIF1